MWGSPLGVCARHPLSLGLASFGLVLASPGFVPFALWGGFAPLSGCAAAVGAVVAFGALAAAFPSPPGRSAVAAPWPCPARQLKSGRVTPPALHTAGGAPRLARRRSGSSARRALWRGGGGWPSAFVLVVALGGASACGARCSSAAVCGLWWVGVALGASVSVRRSRERGTARERACARSLVFLYIIIDERRKEKPHGLASQASRYCRRPCLIGGT